MSNPVTDTLTDWQDDAAGDDTNHPQPYDKGGTTSPNSLSGEIRQIKSTIRELSLNMGWEDWAGLLTAPSLEMPTATSGTDGKGVTFDGDWLTPGIATVGQRIRVRVASTSNWVYGNIVAVTATSGHTDVLLDVPADTFTGATFTQVEFGSVGSPVKLGADSIPADDGQRFTSSPIPMDVQTTTQAPIGPVLTIPPSAGGTGRVSMVLARDLLVGGVAEGDLLDETWQPDVAIPVQVTGVQGKPWSSAPPGDETDVVPYWYTNAQWNPTPITTIMRLVTTITDLADPLSGYTSGNVTLPAATDATQVTIKWSVARSPSLTAGEQSSITITWDTAFPTNLDFVLGFASNAGIVVGWDADVELGTTTVWIKNVTASTIAADQIIGVLAIGH